MSFSRIPSGLFLGPFIILLKCHPVVEDGGEFSADPRTRLLGLVQAHAGVRIDVALDTAGVRLAVGRQAVAGGVLPAGVPGRRLLRLPRGLARHAADRFVDLGRMISISM